MHSLHPFWRQPWSRGSPIIPMASTARESQGSARSALSTAEWKEHEQEIRAGFWKHLAFVKGI